MAMPHSRSGWTLEMVHALPDDGNRYELIDGELFVTPAPTGLHQSATVRLWALLDDFTREHGLKTLCAPFGVRLSNGGEVQPDVVVFPRAPGTRIPAVADIRDLVLAVEILSPGTQRTDRHEKRHLYQSNGVAEYWIVDLDARTIDRWRPNDSEPGVASAALNWQPAPYGDTLGIDVQAFFDSAYD